MQNRYFSVENTVKINQIKPANSNDNLGEVENRRFRERKDYLIEKLFKSRTLPLPTGGVFSNTNENSDEVSLKIISDSSDNKIKESKQLLSIIPTKNNIHKEEFIKLSTDDIIVDTEASKSDKSSSFSRKRAYPERCVKRVNQHLFELLKTNPGTYTDRTAEIAKIKINIKSRFDHDDRLIKRIKRDTEVARNSIHEKLEFLEKRRNQKPNNSKNNSNNNNNTNRRDSYDLKTNKNKNVKKIKYIKIDEDTEEEVDEDEDDEDDDIINIIDEQETYLNSNESSSNSDDMDSKCFQLKSLNNKKDKKNAKYESKNLLYKSKKDNRIKIDSQLEELELNYKLKRDERNKLLKKKKNLETNIKREIMTNELKVMRRNLKKLRRKRNSQQKQYPPTNTNGLVYFENKKPIKNKSRYNNNNKNNKKFFKNKQSFKFKTNKPN